MDCIFCKIINGELPSSKVYEDDTHIAILDLFPAANGHTMLIPKKHHVNIFDSSDDLGAKVYPTLARLSRAISDATGCDGINIVQNNGEHAGQVVFHSHIHIIPRYIDDNLHLVIAGKKKATPEYMQETCDLIKKHIE